MVPRIVYIFTSLRNSHVGLPWNISVPSTNHSLRNFPTEGFFFLWNRLIEKGVIGECLTIVESAQGTGNMKFSKKHIGVVMPHIDHLDRLLQEGDIIVPRGGFRPWPAFLTRMNEKKRWLIFYRAASNRLKWPQWDIVLDDLIDKHMRFGNRLHFAFNKPINPHLFPYRANVERNIDLIINASHVHDKKGQWKAVNAVAAYKKIYGVNLRVCMPGGWYGGIETRRLPDKIKTLGLNVSTPGMVPRQELSHLFSRSKVYIHLGVAGQNDRGVMEAMSSGVPVILANTQFHAPFQYKDQRFCTVTKNQTDPEMVARDIHDMLERWTPELARETALYFERENGVDSVVVPQMQKLLEYCAAHPVDREAIMREYGV